MSRDKSIRQGRRRPSAREPRDGPFDEKDGQLHRPKLFLARLEAAPGEERRQLDLQPPGKLRRLARKDRLQVSKSKFSSFPAKRKDNMPTGPPLLGPCDAKPLYLRLECSSLQAESGHSTSRPANHPVRLLQRAEDMIALGLFKRG
jgi:hypothetical protein